MTPRLIDAAAAAEYLGTTERHLERLRDERRIPFTKVGGKVRFDVRALDRWVEANTVPAASDVSLLRSRKRAS